MREAFCLQFCSQPFFSHSTAWFLSCLVAYVEHQKADPDCSLSIRGFLYCTMSVFKRHQGVRVICSVSVYTHSSACAFTNILLGILQIVFQASLLANTIHCISFQDVRQTTLDLYNI